MSYRACVDCCVEKPIADFRRPSRKLSQRCAPCLETRQATARPRDYYHSPEYKRLQRERACKREGREYHAGQGNNPNTRAALLNAVRVVSPNDLSSRAWRTIEVANAKQAWAYWLQHLAPSWWLEQRKAVLRAKANRAGNPAYRAIWRAARQARRARKLNQADGSLSNADVAQMIRTAKDCMWCGVAVTLPVHKRYEPTMATIEHIVPLCQGGLHSKDNVGVACAHCNYSRAKRAA